MPLSGLLSEYGFSGGWPSIFYVFGLIGTVWCLGFLFFVSEDPEQCPRIKENEKKYILSSLWGAAGSSVSDFNNTDRGTEKRYRYRTIRVRFLYEIRKIYLLLRLITLG